MPKQNKNNQKKNNNKNQEIEIEYEVEKIKDKRIINDKIEYLIKWKGYSDFENTWEPIENMSNAKEIIEEYEEKEKNRFKTPIKNIKKKNNNFINNTSIPVRINLENLNLFNEKDNFRKKINENEFLNRKRKNTEKKKVNNKIPFSPIKNQNKNIIKTNQNTLKRNLNNSINYRLNNNLNLKEFDKEDKSNNSLNHSLQTKNSLDNILNKAKEDKTNNNKKKAQFKKNNIKKKSKIKNSKIKNKTKICKKVKEEINQSQSLISYSNALVKKEKKKKKKCNNYYLQLIEDKEKLLKEILLEDEKENNFLIYDNFPKEEFNILSIKGLFKSKDGVTAIILVESKKDKIQKEIFVFTKGIIKYNSKILIEYYESLIENNLPTEKEINLLMN